MNIRLQIMKIEELTQVYNNYLLKDFPPDEVKPLSAMEAMIEKGCYEPLAIICDEQACGYALMTLIPKCDYVLLDYLSIYPDMRGKSLGSHALSALKEYYSTKSIFIESENPDFLTDKVQAIKRLAFYERNGVNDSQVLSTIWGVHYINYYLGSDTLSPDYCKTAIETIYKTMIPNDNVRQEKVKVYLR